MIDWLLITGFDWDSANAEKNESHLVAQSESEQIFFNEPLLILSDEKHSHNETRFHALGRTNDNRLLHVTFTLRKDLTEIRVISARDMHKKERAKYETT
jgi:uncharacterized DUF497 family protein